MIERDRVYKHGNMGIERTLCSASLLAGITRWPEPFNFLVNSVYAGNIRSGESVFGARDVMLRLLFELTIDHEYR